MNQNIAKHSILALLLGTTQFGAMGMHSMSLGGQGPSDHQTSVLELPAAKRQRLETPHVEVKALAAETKAAAATLQAQDKPAAKGPFKLDKLPADLQSTICEYSMNLWDFCEALVIDEVVAAAPGISQKLVDQASQDIWALSPTLFVHLISCEAETHVHVWSIQKDNTLKHIRAFKTNFYAGSFLRRGWNDTILVFDVPAKNESPRLFEIWDVLKGECIAHHTLEPEEDIVCWSCKNKKISVLTQKRFFMLDIHDAKQPTLQKNITHTLNFDDDDNSHDVSFQILSSGKLAISHSNYIDIYDDNMELIQRLDNKPSDGLLELSNTELITMYSNKTDTVITILNAETLVDVQQIRIDGNLVKPIRIPGDAFAIYDWLTENAVIYTKNSGAKEYKPLKAIKIPQKELENCLCFSKKNIVTPVIQDNQVLTLCRAASDHATYYPLQKNNDTGIPEIVETLPDRDIILTADTNNRVHLFKIQQKSLAELNKLNPAHQQILSAVIQRLHRAKTMPCKTPSEKATYHQYMLINYSLLSKLPNSIRNTVKNNFDITEIQYFEMYQDDPFITGTLDTKLDALLHVKD